METEVKAIVDKFFVAFYVLTDAFMYHKSLFVNIAQKNSRVNSLRIRNLFIICFRHLAQIFSQIFHSGFWTSSQNAITCMSTLLYNKAFQKHLTTCNSVTIL